MAKKRILVVDDEKECCELFKDVLKNSDWTVDVSNDGIEAKELVNKNKYDCIFFDCNMQDLSGIELVKIIKEKNPQAKKIMISGYDLVDQDFAVNLGVDIFLRKPVSLQRIKEIAEDG